MGFEKTPFMSLVDVKFSGEGLEVGREGVGIQLVEVGREGVGIQQLFILKFSNSCPCIGLLMYSSAVNTLLHTCNIRDDALQVKPKCALYCV